MSAAPLLLAFSLTAQQADTLRADSAVELGAVVVTATRTAGAARAETPVAISALAPGVMDLGAGRVTADLLRTVQGAFVQQTSAGQGAVILRGLVGNQVLYLVNGIPMNNGTYRDGPGQYLATIDPETIERIEVVRGPASVLYGSDAQGGVVNVMTRPHPARRGWSLGAAAYGSTANNGGRARLSAGFEGPRVTFGAGASLVQAGHLSAGAGRPRQVPTGFSAAGLDARLTLRPAPAHSLTAGLEHFGMHEVPRYDRYVDFRAPAEGRDFRHVFDPQIRQLGFLRHLWRPGRAALTRLETTASLSIQREGRTQQGQDTAGNPEAVVETTRDDVYTPALGIVGTSVVIAGGTPVTLTWGGDVQHDMVRARGRFTALASGTEDPIVRMTADGPIASGRFPDGASMTRGGIFLSVETLMGRRVRATGGLRLSGSRTEADVGQTLGGAVENAAGALTGQVGVVVNLLRGVDISVRAAEGFRAPNLYDLTNVGTVPGGIVLPNVDARPERSLNLEAGVRLARGGGALDLTAYRVTIKDFIDRVPGRFAGDTLFNGERVFLGRNVGEATLHGVEAEAAWRQDPVELRSTLLYTRGTQVTGSREEAMSKIPPLGGTAEVRVRPGRGRVTAAWRLSWAATQDRLSSRDLRDPRIPAGGTDGYVVHSFIGSAVLTEDLTLSLGFENVGDVLYRTHASGVDAPGRHVWLGMNLFQPLGR